MTDPTYQQLMELFKEISILDSIRGVLFWDLNTGMPSNGLSFRAEQFSWLQQQLHKLWIHPKFVGLITTCEKNGNLSRLQARNTLLCRREFDNRTNLPLELVKQLAGQANRTQEIWKKAKAANNFAIVLPDLRKLFELNLERATILAENKGTKTSFDALIELREPGYTVDSLTKVFEDAKSTSMLLLKKIRETDPDKPRILTRHIPKSAQRLLIDDLSQFLGYPKDKGRIDEVEHPITFGCGPQDVRVTVKYHKDHVFNAVSACIHECGHAIHSLQKNAEWSHLPVNSFSFPSLSESQSRFFENIIGLSQEFWSHYYPRFQKLTSGRFDDVPFEKFYSAINAVSPGRIRIEADELTYLLHVIIRFELEKELFTGKASVEELPDLWNEKYERYLGVEIDSDTKGVMQDIHWYSHYWGYFFGYSMGDIISAQLTFRAMGRELDDWRHILEGGNFTPIREWLATNIHSKGALYDTLELVKKVSGEGLTAKYYKDYLTQKYTTLYQL